MAPQLETEYSETNVFQRVRNTTPLFSKKTDSGHFENNFSRIFEVSKKTPKLGGIQEAFSQKQGFSKKRENRVARIWHPCVFKNHFFCTTKKKSSLCKKSLKSEHSFSTLRKTTNSFSVVFRHFFSTNNNLLKNKHSENDLVFVSRSSS